jgi:hypothetical protein
LHSAKDLSISTDPLQAFPPDDRGKGHPHGWPFSTTPFYEMRLEEKARG